MVPSVKAFRVVAFVEAVSFLMLLVATAIKYSGGSEVGVKILGPVHGFLFLAFVFMAWLLREPLAWDARTTLLVMLGAVLPFGGFVVDRWLARTYSDGVPAA